MLNIGLCTLDTCIEAKERRWTVLLAEFKLGQEHGSPKAMLLMSCRSRHDEIYCKAVLAGSFSLEAWLLLTLMLQEFGVGLACSDCHEHLLHCSWPQ